jgi:hypothetical protein
MCVMCVDVCYPNEGVTCGVYGQDVSVYFFITPMQKMNYTDDDSVQIQGVNGVSFSLPFGNPVSQAQRSNVIAIRPEHTCGIVVNSTTVHDSGQYMCTITHTGNITWSVTLNQTLQICGR